MKVRLGDYIKEYSERNKQDSNIPVYSVTNSQGFVSEYFSKEVASKDKTTYKLVPKGYFAYNPSRINVGSVDFQRKEDCVIVSPLYVVFHVSDELDKSYLLYYLKSQPTLCQIKHVATGSVRDNLKFSYLADFNIELKPIEEQKTIAKTLQHIETLIALYKKQLAKLDELVKCRFVELFGDVKNNPYGWKSETVDSVTLEIIGGVSVNGESRKLKDGELAVLKVSAVTYGIFKDNEYKVISNDIKLGKYISPKAGDLLFSRANTKELVGATALVDKDYPNLLLPDKLWKIVTCDSILPVYLKAYLSEPWIRDLMSKSATGTSGSMYNISMEKLRMLPVLLPPIERQTTFANFVRRIDKLRIVIQQSLDETQKLFDSLMQEYFG